MSAQADGALSRVLYIEDERDLQTVGRMALEKVGGFTVHICASGAEALEQAPGFAPQMILLDVMMPGMDGPTTFLKLRELPEIAEVPIVFITANAEEHEVSRYMELGALAVILKPFDALTLPKRLSELWEQQRS